jgi:uncharacterized membrane protein
MVNKKHEDFEKRNEKWRNASIKSVEIRYALDDILSSFSEEEKQSKRYAQFIETISQQFDHLLGDVNKKKLEEEKTKTDAVKKKNGWLSYKSAIIAMIGAIAVALVQILPQLITSIASLFGGTP